MSTRVTRIRSNISDTGGGEWEITVERWGLHGSPSPDDLPVDVRAALVEWLNQP